MTGYRDILYEGPVHAAYVPSMYWQYQYKLKLINKRDCIIWFDCYVSTHELHGNCRDRWVPSLLVISEHSVNGSIRRPICRYGEEHDPSEVLTAYAFAHLTNHVTANWWSIAGRVN